MLLQNFSRQEIYMIILKVAKRVNFISNLPFISLQWKWNFILPKGITLPVWHSVCNGNLFFFFSIPGIKGPRNSGLTDWLECYLPWPLSPFLVDHLEHSSLKISENISRSEGEQSPALGFPQAYLTPVITAHTEESSCPTRTWDTWRHMDHVSCGGRATTRTTVFKTVHPVDRMHLGNELPHPPPHLEKPWRFRFLEDCENKRDTRASS